MARTTDEALDGAALAHLVGFQLALADAASRRVFQRHVGTPFGLRPVEFSLLVLLWANGGAAPKQIAQALALAAPAVTGLVDRLAGRGLVERRRSASDGRAVQVLPTAKGAELARRAHRASLAMEETMLGVLSPGERVMLRELLVKLVRGA